MIVLDEEFLKRVGLSEMAEDKKAEFLSQTQEELEIRIGEKMSENMNVEQLKEFDGIMNSDRDTMVKMLEKIGDYKNDEIFKKLLKRHNATDANMEILSEYLSVKWIQINRPDYADITKSVAQQLEDEIAKAKDQILANNR